MNPFLSLIGGVGMTRVQVYAQRPAPDGKFSGCPHLHALTDEAYYVLEGAGQVEFFDATSGFRNLRLAPGMYVHFPPLVLHRIVSEGDLAILGIMGNAGLAERGDARIYFGSEADENTEVYEELRSLPNTLGLEGALQRRDAAVIAYLQLLEDWEIDRNKAAKRFGAFVETHLKTAAELRPSFAMSIEAGPLAWGRRTESRLAALPGPADSDRGIEYQPQAETTSFGMCGVLHPVSSLIGL